MQSLWVNNARTKKRKKNNKISFYKDINQVIDNLDEIMESNYTIFAKGSNSINIRRLITHLKQENI